MGRGREIQRYTSRAVIWVIFRTALCDLDHPGA